MVGLHPCCPSPVSVASGIQEADILESVSVIYCKIALRNNNIPLEHTVNAYQRVHLQFLTRTSRKCGLALSWGQAGVTRQLQATWGQCASAVARLESPGEVAQHFEAHPSRARSHLQVKCCGLPRRPGVPQLCAYVSPTLAS
ncbi:hypothetical protein H8959_007904 [Pygathrix nigripes]